MSEFTGERVIPGEVDIDLLNEHVARYAFAERLARGKRVLDAGCGVGYGSFRLAREARQVVGLEIAAEALDAARQRYAAPNAGFVRGDCRRLPFPDASFDLVVAFEVIEHLEGWEALLAEARRVVGPSGALVVSTPNRLYYSEQRDTPNPFHVHEFDYREFCDALGRHFSHVRVFLENHMEGVVFSPAERDGVDTMIERSEANPDEAHFMVAVCSAGPMAAAPIFVYVPSAGNVLRRREKHIALLEAELEQKNQWLEETKESLDALNRQHQALEKRATEIIEALEAENARKTEWNRQTEAELERVKGLHEALRAEFEERSRWAAQLEAERAELEAKYRRLADEEQKVRQDLKTAVDQLHATEAELESRTAWARDLDRELAGARARIEALTAKLAAIYASPAYRVGKVLGLAPPRDL